jgi:REP element-mobilizing transposase RayT
MKREGEWHNRGYVPHCNAEGQLQFITFRLIDSIPVEAVQQMMAESADVHSRNGGWQARLEEKLVDLALGECWLRQPEVAEIVMKALFEGHSRMYELIAWVIMPNHVHLALIVYDGVSIEKVMQRIKGRSARLANRELGRAGAFWARDYFDTYARDEGHVEKIVSYIHNNPVKAGLCEAAELWPYSSAWREEGDSDEF